MSQNSLYHSQCWIDGKLQPATITVEDGKIIHVELGERLDRETSREGILMPGVIDVHVHVNEPGRTEWEGFQTATQAAAAGGITTLIDMPLNSSPVTTSISAYHDKLNAAQDKLWVNAGFYAGVVPGNADQLIPLSEAGVMGYKCFLVHSGIDEFPNVSLQDLEKAMPLIATTGKPLLVHAEIDQIAADTLLSQHPSNYREYVKSRPGFWEEAAVDMMIELCRKHDCPVHIVHVSAASVLEKIRNAKLEGLPLTAETCPHYILFNEEDIPDGNTLFKCAPPIRDRKNNELLRLAVKSGVLDLLASDHSPATPDIKELTSGNLQKAWGGIAGLQFLLAASWTALRDQMSLVEFVPKLTASPARMLNIHHRKGAIKPGMDADLVWWNPHATFKLSESDIKHRHKASPYANIELYGKVMRTMVNGRVVFEEDSIHDRAGMFITTV